MDDAAVDIDAIAVDVSPSPPRSLRERRAFPLPSASLLAPPLRHRSLSASSTPTSAATPRKRALEAVDRNRLKSPRVAAPLLLTPLAVSPSTPACKPAESLREVALPDLVANALDDATIQTAVLLAYPTLCAPEALAQAAALATPAAVSFLCRWLLEHPADFSPALLDRLEAFAATLASDMLRSMLCERIGSAREPGVRNPPPPARVWVARASEPRLRSRSDPIQALRRRSSMSLQLSVSGVLVGHAKEVGLQLTLLESELFAALQIHDLLRKAGTVDAMVRRFNAVSQWVAHLVLEQEKAKDRGAVLVAWIEALDQVRRANNFSGVMQILAGLQSAAVHRLKRSWAHVGPKALATLDRIRTEASSDASFKALRLALHTASPPCIPHIGMYLTDLIFIEEGNPDPLDAPGMLNYTRCELAAAKLREIKLNQQITHRIDPHPVVLPIVESAVEGAAALMDEEQAYQRSLEVEPRKRN